LVQALDPDAMAPVLQDLLVDGWRVAWCTPERPLVQPGEGICLRYQVGLREPGSSRVVERLIAGRLFNDVDGAAEWLAESVLPLAAVAAGRADVSPFDRLAMLLPSLRLVLHAFPVDPDRPGLIRATDPTHLNDLLTQALGDTAGGLELAECRPHVVRYDRERCVIRYEVMWNVRHTGRVVKQVMYGKVYDGPGGAGVERAAARLSALPTRTGGRSLVIPRFRAYLPEQQLVLLDAIPGRSWIGSLVREAAADPARLATLYGAVESAAEVTATLHHGSYGAGPLRTLDGECADARAEIAAVAPWAPALAASLAAELDLVEDGIGSPSGPPAFAHGDLTPGQLLFDGPLIGLVDLDRTGAAERALDLGSFTSALAVSAVKAHPAGSRLQTSRAAELGGRYLSAYRRAAGLSADELSAARVGAYRRVSLVRTAVRSWRQLKPARVMVAQQLLADSRREDVVGDTSAAGVAYLNS
jgi:hypothetical protein